MTKQMTVAVIGSLRVKIYKCNCFLYLFLYYTNPASILYKSIAGSYRPVRVADGPITARYRFIKNAYWEPAFCK